MPAGIHQIVVTAIICTVSILISNQISIHVNTTIIIF